jgi:uncharacterized protein YjbJ (UPF0337 family)
MEAKMDWDELSYAWKQLKARIKYEWANITDEGLMHLRGRKNMLVGKIQERYTTLKDEAERQLDDIFQAQQRAADRSGTRES